MAEYDVSKCIPRYVLVNGVPGQAGVVVEGLHQVDDEDVVNKLTPYFEDSRNKCVRSPRNRNMLVMTTFVGKILQDGQSDIQQCEIHQSMSFDV